MINVPNGQEIMDESLYYEVVQEHINYFTPYSISQMAHNAGFEIIEIEDVPQTVELDIYVKKPMRGIGFYQHLHTLREALAQMLASYRSVVAWGAGAKSAKYANLLGDPSLIERLIDSDVKKIGMYVPGVNCPIELATAEAVRESPAVIIFASSYNTEIIERLRGDFGYVGDIIFFQDGRNVKVLKCD